MPPSSLPLGFSDRRQRDCSTILYWPCLILQFDTFVSYRIPSHWSQRDNTLLPICSHLYMQCYGNDDHLASWALGSLPIPAVFKVIGRNKTAHQQFKTSLPATNCSSVFSQRCSFFFVSLYPCRCHTVMHDVVFVDISFKNLLLLLIMAKPSIFIIFRTDECTMSWHMDIDFNSKVKTPTSIFFFCWSTWLYWLWYIYSRSLFTHPAIYVTPFSRYG